MVGGKAFLGKPKHQHQVSQWGEHDCHTDSQKNGDCYENLSLPHLMDELWFYERCGKKIFSCQTNASVSCILMSRNDYSA